MYTIGKPVWCRSQEHIGYVAERNYTLGPKPKSAVYVVDFHDPDSGNTIDFTTVTKDLRAADWCCHRCRRWLAKNKQQRFRGNGIVECFTCTKEEPFPATPIEEPWETDWYKDKAPKRRRGGLFSFLFRR
jgi:hypothetical protein